MAQEIEEVPTHWSQVIHHGSKPIEINFQDDCCLIITNACLGEYPENIKKTPVRLVAHVKTTHFELDDEHEEGKKEECDESTVLIASFVPGKIEHQRIQTLFSAYNEVTMEIQGEVDVHLMGYLSAADAFDEEEEEEDGKEEEKNE